MLGAALAVGCCGYWFYQSRIAQGWGVNDGIMFHQNLMSLINGDGLQSGFNYAGSSRTMTHYLSWHAMWILYPFSRLYSLKPEISTFLLWQTLFISLVLFVVYFFSPDRKRGLVLSGLIAASAPFWGLIFSGTHCEATAIWVFPLLGLLVVLRWPERNQIWWKILFGFALIYGLSLREDLALLLFGWGLLGALLDAERRRAYLAIAILSLMVSVIDLMAIRTIDPTVPNNFQYRFGWLFGRQSSADFGAVNQWRWRGIYLLGCLAWLAPVLFFLRQTALRLWLPTLLATLVAMLENLASTYLGQLFLIGHYQVFVLSTTILLAAIAAHQMPHIRQLAVSLLVLSIITWSLSTLTPWVFLSRTAPVMIKDKTAVSPAILKSLNSKTPWQRGRRYAVSDDLLLLSRPASLVEDLDDLLTQNELPKYVLIDTSRRIQSNGARSIAPEILNQILDRYYGPPREVEKNILLFMKLS